MPRGARAGARHPLRMEDVARSADVHPSTVSRALDPEKMWLVQPETRQRVLAAAEELGYVPHAVARALRSGRSMTIGVVIADLTNPFITVVLRGIAAVVDKHGFIPLIAETRDERGRLKQLLEGLRARRVDAVITSAARRADAGLLRRFAESTPVVLAVRDPGDRSLPAVTHDDKAGGELAALHLSSLGHKVVAQLAGPSDISSFYGRQRGFEHAARAAGMQVVSVGDEALRPTASEGRRLAERMLSLRQPLPTAVFAHNDEMAVAAIDVLRRAGLRCPKDVSVIGYNDAPLSDHLSPSLSTIRFPGEQVGRFAAEIALGRIENPTGAAASVSFPPELVERESTGRAPGGSPHPSAIPSGTRQTRAASVTRAKAARARRA